MKNISLILKSMTLTVITTIGVLIILLLHLFVTASREIEGSFTILWGAISYEVVLDDPYLAEMLVIGPGENLIPIWLMMSILFITYLAIGFLYKKRKLKTEQMKDK